MRILIVAPHFPSPDFYKSRSLDPRSYFLIDYARCWVESGHEVTVFHTPPRYPALLKSISDLIDLLPFFRSNPIRRFIREKAAISDACYSFNKIEIFRRSVFKMPGWRRYSRISLNKAIEDFKDRFDLDEYRFDVVFLDYVEPSLEIASRMGVASTVKKWCILHVTDISYMRKARNYFLKRLSQVDGILYRNNGIKEDLALASESALEGVIDGIIPSGISESINFGSPRMSKVKKFLYVGRLVKEKKVECLIDAICFLKERGVECNLTIVGEGPLKHKLESYVRTLALGDLVSFTGKIPHSKVFECMRTHDCLMMVSKETFGM